MTTQEKIAVMQAFVEGKEIEVKKCGIEQWVQISRPIWDWGDCEYRIKPEHPKPKVRPYKDAEELMEAIKVHGSWVKDRKGNYHSIMAIVFEGGKWTINGMSPEWCLDNVTFADGTPFGVEEGGSNE